MTKNPVVSDRAYPALQAVCAAPSKSVDTCDIGELNLLCAIGLPGAEELDVLQNVAWLEDAARQVDLQVRSRLDEFAEHPGRYNNSFGYFCCNFLLRTLQELCCVQYNPARIMDSDFQNPLCINPDFRDSRDLFLHGIVNGSGGTCASMPVLYVAVGRRLGYPLKLVEAPGHLFFRWEDPEGRLFNVPERFNVEGTGHGISFYPDEFYRTWPSEWQPIDEIGGWYLKSLSPAEELATFLALRGSCLQDNGRWTEAMQAFEWASSLAPTDLRYHSIVVELQRQEVKAAIHELDNERQSLAERRMLLTQQSTGVAIDLLRRDPSHPDSCQCARCRHRGRPSQQAVGHPHGCHCPMCNPQRR